MGKVVVKNVLLRNQRDEILLTEGFGSKVRELRLEMIADTGAVAVSLPQSLVDQLGLPFERDVNITTSRGEKHPTKLYGGLMVYIGDRKAYTQCLAKPEDAPLILGQLVFEQIDYVVDCKNQMIYPNPKETDGIMLFEDFSCQ
ncbi:MAG: hypothetical protein HQM11_04540 [SAR324 cluster bacterium]|nr:hypothetical protein [SAR324 cluster bacterium]